MLKDENGKRIKLDSKKFHTLLKEDPRKIQDLKEIIAAKCFNGIHAVDAWINGKNSPGDLDKVKTIAEVLNVDYQELVYEVCQNEVDETESQIVINTEEEKLRPKRYKKYSEESNFEVGKDVVDVLDSTNKDNVWNLFKEKMKEEQFRNGIYAVLVAFMSMLISSLIDKTGDYKVGWGFILMMLWSLDFLLHNFPNLYGWEIFSKDEFMVKAYRVIDVSLSAVILTNIIITQSMMLIQM